MTLFTRSHRSWCCGSPRRGAGAIRAITPTPSLSGAIRKSPFPASRPYGYCPKILQHNERADGIPQVILHCFGKLTKEEQTFIPDGERRKSFASRGFGF